MNVPTVSKQASLPTRLELVAAERRARHFWVAVIVGLLSLQVAGGITSVILAVGDPSAAIVPHYHQSALNWDSTRRARQLTQQLGWQIHTSVGQWMQDSGTRELQVEIKNAEGLAIEELNLSARIFHHARGRDVQAVRLVEKFDGVYAAEVGLVQSGVWQVDLKIEGDHGVASESREVLVN